jgi:glycosyltransferase involved in cell wall biosynthesis
MPAPRTLTIVTAAPHHEWQGRIWSHTPYVREIDLWTHLFDRVIIVGPQESTPPPGDCVPFASDRIELRGVPPTGGDRMREKARQLALLPLLVWRVGRAIRAADATHVRCPGNVGLLGVLLTPLLSRRMVAKYAGQWNGFPGEKWTVRLQRRLLGSRWWRGPVTVYGDWPDQRAHVVPFFTSVLTEDQIEQARRRRRTPRRAGVLRLLYVGRLTGPKHIDAVLRAVARVAGRGVDVTCTIVGGGAEREHLEEVAEAEGIGERVHFTGAVGLDDVLRHYEQADALVLVSQSEGWPKAIAEAMTFGLVCVGSTGGMVPQMLGDGRGLVVPPGDELALTDALVRLATDPAAADAMAERAAAWAREHSLEKLERAIADLLTRWWEVPVGAEATRAHGLRRPVVQVTDTLDAGGAERVAVNLVNRLDRDRYQPLLCTTRHEGILAAETDPAVERLCLHRRHRIGDPLAVLRLAAFLRRRGVEVVHAHGTSLFISAAACALAPGARLVWHDHLGANIASRSSREWLYRVGAGRADHVITVNRGLEHWAVDVLGLPPSRVTTIPNFVVPSHRSSPPADLPGDPDLRIACVANLRREKDHVGLITAMASVARRQPGAHALLIGAPADDEVVREVEDRIRQLGVTGSVTLLGARTDVDAVLAGCSLGVLPSRSEGFPLALLEYGRAGLPAVATDVGECAEILDHGRAGRLVPPGRPSSLADAIVELLGDREAAIALGARLRSRVDEHYGADLIVDRFESLYEQVVGEVPVPA